MGFGFPVEGADLRGYDGVSADSSSKSNGFAVVSDSGGASGFYCLLVDTHL